MEFTRFLLSGFLLLLGLLLGIGGANHQHKNLPRCRFPAIYNFGDSNSDTGAISAAFKPIPPPYGESFFGKHGGRNCDGRLVIDFIAERLRLPYLSSYLNSLGANYRHGANFATGGSTIQMPNETIYANPEAISPFFLDMQIIQFNQFKQRAAELYNAATKPSHRNHLPRPEDYSKALYTFDIGQNDLTLGFRTRSTDELRAALPDMANELASAVHNLYEQGGRTFWIHNTGPIGCLPVNLIIHPITAPGYRDQDGCLKFKNDMAMDFNDHLKHRVTQLRAELPEAAITYVDVYAAKYELISKAKQQGFGDPLKVCCGYHEGGDNVWCGSRSRINNGSDLFGDTCRQPGAAVMWDGVHYTQAANQWVARHVLYGSFTDPPTPITQACHRRKRM